MGFSLVPTRVVPMGMCVVWWRSETLGVGKCIVWVYQVEDMVVIIMVVEMGLWMEWML